MKQAPEEPPAAEGETRQLPLVNVPVNLDEGTTGTGPVPPKVDEDVESVVPQETVPMPAAEWHSARTGTPVPHLSPPQFRKSSADRSEHDPLAERPGLLTTELRRALPPWALPLLTFQPFSVWLGSRIGLTLLAIVAGVMLPSVEAKGTANWYGLPGGPPLTGISDRLGGVWTRWDGQWYLKIATEGYQKDDGTAAFSPLYPSLVRVFGWLAGERFIWAGIFLSGLFFLGALVLLHRLVRLDFAPTDAARTILYTAAFPMAFFFSAVYSESLFLFLAVATFLAARSGRWWVAALAVSAAIWTRSTGLLLLLPLAWELWRAFHPPLPKEADAMPPARPSTLSLASPVLPLLSLVALLVWSAGRFGDPLAQLKAQSEWNRHFSLPWETVMSAFREAGAMAFRYQAENQSWTYLAALLLFVVLAAVSTRWLRGSYSLFLWIGIVFPLFSATPHNPLLSFPRFAAVLFPAFIVLALVGRNRYAHQIIMWSSLLLLALYTIRFVNWYWVA